MLKTQYNICYLSYDGIADPLGQSQILPYLIKLNKINEFNFTIISFEKKRNLNKFSQLKLKLKKEKINWISLTYRKHPPVLSTLVDLIKLNIVLKKELKNNGIDFIHCRSYITSLIGLKFKKKYKIPFLFDMRGFYADERIDGKIWNKNNFIFNLIYKFFKYKEKQFLQLSNHTISLTLKGKKEIQSWKLPNLSPIKIIPCCTDSNLFSKENIMDLRPELGLKNSDFVISYVGSIGTWYMLDEMLDFFKILLNKHKKSKFLFITKDNPDQIFKKCLKKNISNKSILVKEASRDLMPSYIGISNFSIFFILPLYSKKASSPTKMGEIMSLGIPVICNSDVGDIDEIMKKSMPELLVHNFNSHDYDRITDLILNNYKADTEKIIQTSRYYYSLKNGAKKYLDIYNQILK